MADRMVGQAGGPNTAKTIFKVRMIAEGFHGRAK